VIKGMCDIVVITGWVDLDIPIEAASQVLTKRGVMAPSKAVDEGLVGEEHSTGRRSDGKRFRDGPVAVGGAGDEVLHEEIDDP